MSAVIVCPGGSYTNLAMNHEGRQVANFLNSQGIVAFVLKYRLGPNTTTRWSSATHSAPPDASRARRRVGTSRPIESALSDSQPAATWR